MATFDILGIGLSALQAQQLVQQTISHNVANVNTPGFSRRDAYLATLPPDGLQTGSPAGLGVRVSAIRRAASDLLNRQITHESGAQAHWQALSDGTTEVEKLFQEPGATGLQSVLDTFWTSWKDLSVDPTSKSARVNVIQAADTLAASFRRTFSGIMDFTTRVDQQLQTQVDHLNDLTSQIAQINTQVSLGLANGDEVSDLRDRRDTLVEELGQLTQVQTGETKNGSLTITIQGHLLVQDSGATAINLQRDAQGHAQIVWSDDKSKVGLGDGQISASFEMRDWALQDVVPGLNALAATVIQSVNSLHQKGYTTDGRTNLAFFTGSDASDIAVSSAVANDTSALAVSAAAGTPGDGSQALAIFQLQQQTMSGLGDTVGGAYAALVGRLGLAAEKAGNMSSQEDDLVQFLNGRRSDLAGVSLDEEAVQLMGAQKAYAAAARVITAVDQMLETLINGTGMVGR